MAKTLRVHLLAKELGVTSKEVIEKCRAEGIELKNHMAAISLGLAESIREWFSAGEDVTSIEISEKVDLVKVLAAAQKRARRAPRAEPGEAEVSVAEAEPAPGAELLEVAEPTPVEIPLPAEVGREVVEPPTELRPPIEPAPAPAAAGDVPVVAIPPRPAAEVQPLPAEPEVLLPAAKQELVVPEAAPARIVPPPPPPEPIVPAGPKLVPKPAELRGPRLVRIEAPEPLRPLRARSATATPAPTIPDSGLVTVEGGRPARGRGREKEDDSDALKGRSRSPRRRGHTPDLGERLQEWRNTDLQERAERLASATGHGLKERRAAEQRRQAAAAAAAGPAARRAPVEIAAPVAVKEFCAAVGASFATVSKSLLAATGRLWTINQALDAETAEVLALDLGVQVTIARQRTALERLQDEFQRRERQELKPRPPVVAMLGHVDHGKTSLLDAIRQTEVAKGEAGGITQHIGAYRLDRGGWQVTFLDTPGHEAFTAMRARGANLTDVVVLVVAADDGVMPQTIEALNHARAAGVPVVVALNKMDLPNIDLNRIFAQLAEHGLTPSEWGGQTDVIKTSAVTGAGIDDLVAHLSTLSELMVLQADSTVPVQGTVIEAEMREGQGVVAQVLVREGTLRPGQIVVCGSAVGRVRMLQDDRGRVVADAWPGWPVAISGLDVLPATGDTLYQVDDLKLAKQIAAEAAQRRRDETLEAVRKPRTLKDLLAAGDESQVPELNVIVRADVQGSVDVLKKALGDFPSDKAQLRILHAAVGAISEADVHLARASNAIVIGFYVVPEDRARQLAEQLGVEIRQYRVIYEILDDMYKALAGLLEPVRREEIRGAAEVRQVFNISRVGTVAGCLVTSGAVARSHKLRLVRDGRVIVPAGTMHSLKRFKDDAREVRAGLECGIKLEGFDDVKPGDVIETYELIEELQKL